MMILSVTALTISALAAAPLPREFRGVWVATVDNIDWPSKRTLTTAEQKRELLQIVDVADKVHLNAIIFQVRPSADSLYQSSIEPWSEYLTGASGLAPSPAWDPLAYLVEKAHARGIEVHAWFNPYRAFHPSAKTEQAASHVTKTHPEAAPQYGRYKWMIPTESFVQNRTTEVMLDVARRYDVDGVHIDDYFYPYPEKGSDGKPLPFPDDESYAAYLKRGGYLGKPDWRRRAVNNFIKDFYMNLKKVKPWVKFGISPFGIWRPGFPAGTTAGIDQRETLYADCKLWLNEGWLDYMTPQLYWPIAQKLQAYPALLDWWISENSHGRHIWPGNYTGRVLENWQPQEVLDQIKETRLRPGSTGNVHFSMKVFLKDGKGLNEALLGETYSERALVPESPWLGSTLPVAPGLKRSGNKLMLTPLRNARFWVLAGPDQKILRMVAAEQTEFVVNPSDLGGVPLNSCMIAATSRTGVLGRWTKIK